ncbi:MAG: putative molybdenum carrier protein [Betaproteobacteria bacterium]|nr:putative molybdenum carrier protein [Betaproteobacteria bacterium]
MLKIVSGGQTGVDRAALDAALDAGAPCGGWCPPGRIAEDGPLAPRYPLRELPTGGYRERTHANVRDSDGTLVIHCGELEGGTAQTVGFCVAHGKPHQLIDGNAIPAESAAGLVREFIARHRIAVLNVGGPRASKQPAIYAYAHTVMTLVLKGERSDRGA